MDDVGVRDFDFLMGTWSVSHRRLKGRLAGSSTWEEFDGTTSAYKVMGGQGNIDDNVVSLPGGSYRALTLRAFDSKTRLWSIWWLDARMPHALDPPVIGSFENGVGTFYADDVFEGRPIRVRFRWTRTDTASPGWEQAFSPDGGATWETNWVMAFTRTGA
ncbi:MAG: DUF1579 domain-containing protein [Alphaproteobacteria bacterium]|nr:DUF1579 domain-containing protein [Alphaproteobacteria bacterium]